MYETIHEKYKQSTLLDKYIKVFAVVSLYWFVSILTVFINKYLLSGDEIKLEAPLFITWFQCAFSALICFLGSCLAKLYPKWFTFPEGNPLKRETIRRVLPLSLLFILMVSSNNLCLKYVGVAFYYVGRSLTTVFNVLLSYILLQQKISAACMACCFCIVIGFLMGVDQENLSTTFSWRGTIYGVLGSLSLALYSINTKKSLQYVNQEIWLLSYCNNLYSSVLFLPLILLNEELSVILSYDQMFERHFMFAMLVGGICGFSIGYVTALQIKITSPLTHNISGTAKACAQTIIATQWYDEVKSFLWWTSNAVVLLASAAYTRIKQLEMQKQHNNLNLRGV